MNACALGCICRSTAVLCSASMLQVPRIQQWSPNSSPVGRPLHVLKYSHYAASASHRVQLARGRSSTACSAFLLSTGANVAKYDALANTPVLSVSDGASTSIADLWSSSEMSVVVFARSFGCPFCQCAPSIPSQALQLHG